MQIEEEEEDANARAREGPFNRVDVYHEMDLCDESVPNKERERDKRWASKSVENKKLRRFKLL